jgi:hypothetical protein
VDDKRGNQTNRNLCGLESAVLARIRVALKLTAIWTVIIASFVYGTLRGIVRWTVRKLMALED